MLRELNLSSSQLASSLFAFNLGVEVGQLAIVTAIFPILSSLRRFSWNRILVKGASAAVLAVGVFWAFERLLL